MAFSPPLADKLAVQTSDGSVTEIAVKVIEIVRPDILTQIMRRIAWRQIEAASKHERINRSEIRPGPIRHEVLSAEHVSRIRLIRASLLGVCSHSMDFWKDGFKRDMHPSMEIACWERIAAVFHEYVTMSERLDVEQYNAVFQIVFGLSVGLETSKLATIAERLPGDALSVLRDLFQHPEPIYDIAEEGRKDETEYSAEDHLLYESLDKEVLPRDLPEDLIRELMRNKKVEGG